MNETKIALRKAIKQLYNTFEKYPKPDPADRGFPLTGDDLKLYNKTKIYAMPLRLIDGDILLTHGTPEQYKYFLPRIFESYFDKKGWGFSHTIPKLTLANWFTWDDEERQAVTHYLMTMWEYVLTDYQPSGSKYERVELAALRCLTGFMDVYTDISPFLEKWEQIGNTQASLQIMRILEKWWRDGFFLGIFGYITIHYPESEEKNKQRLLDWMGSPHVRKRLEDLKSLKPDDEEFQKSFLMASYSHDSLRNDW